MGGTGMHIRNLVTALPAGIIRRVGIAGLLATLEARTNDDGLILFLIGNWISSA
jgi:hypothetical protein